MKKVIGIISLAILLTSCGTQNQENQNATGSVSQSGSIIENTQTGSLVDEIKNETQTGSEIDEEINDSQSDDSQSDDSQEYGFSSTVNGNTQINTQSGSDIQTDVNAEMEISDTQEEQLIQETMDELNEFFELLENTDA